MSLSTNTQDKGEGEGMFIKTLNMADKIGRINKTKRTNPKASALTGE